VQERGYQATLLATCHLFDLEKMKNDDAGGMGCVLVAMLNSESRLGRAEIPSSISSMSVRTETDATLT
jgi:hypothetical protein